MTGTIDWKQAFAPRTERIKPSDIREFLKLLGQPGVISFAGGIPDPELFPVGPIREATTAIMNDPDLQAAALQYAVSEGYRPLRQWLVDYMTIRGVTCDIDNIVITTGSQQALDLLAKLFISPGDTVLLSAPAYLGAIQALEVYEPEYANLDDTTAEPGSARLAYVVPDFSNPSGECLDTDQRHRLLDRVAACNVPLIEDAAYESLRYDGTHQPSLQSLDIARTGGIDQSRVIYCGTFSKTIAPGLRVGWICAAREVVHKVVLTRQAADLHGSHLDQMILHRVVSRGFAAQVQKILPVYRERRDLMLAALERYMPEGVSWVRPEGGMFIWLTLPEGLDSRELLQVSLASEGIIFVPGSSFFTDGGGGRHIRLNYTKASPAIIEDGIRRLGALITRQLTDAPVSIDAEPAIPVM